MVLCADDFGISDAVSEGILALLTVGRLSATSVMTNGLGSRRPLEALRVQPGIGVGLHLNLTAGSPLGRMPELAPKGVLPTLGSLIGRALGGRLPAAEIAAEIDRQLDAFEDAFGRPPDFLDGHRHVHLLRGVREALVSVLRGRGLSSGFWIRDPTDAPAAILRRPAGAKALVVTGLAMGFHRRVQAAGLACNAGFSGFTTFHEGDDLPTAFERLFDGLGPRPVVMCHPGGIDENLRRLDPVIDSRPRELAYLASDRFGKFLARRGIALVPSPLP